jgi:hypothetical protein
MLYGLGLNWLIFNAFIGLVFSGMMGDALFRSVIDVAAVGLAMLLLTKVVAPAVQGVPSGD